MSRTFLARKPATPAGSPDEGITTNDGGHGLEVVFPTLYMRGRKRLCILAKNIGKEHIRDAVAITLDTMNRK